MSLLESLPVELIADILSETDVPSLIIASRVSRRLRHITLDAGLDPWRRPIIRNLRAGIYDRSLDHLSGHISRRTWIEIISTAAADYVLFEATLPHLKESEWEECFRRRFLPGWIRWKKASSWRAAFQKALYRVWHRANSSCRTDEAWTRYLVINRNATATQLESSSRNFNPISLFDAMKLQNNLMQFETRIRLVVQFADVRILAFGVLNTPKTSFSVNENAWSLLHPPGVRLPESSQLESEALVNPFHDHGLSQLRHPAPAMCHENYPMYTPGGQDRRWVQRDELRQSRLKWVGSMMLVAQLVGPHTMETWSDGPPLQDADFIVGPSRNQYASLCFEDLFALAPWMDEMITQKLTEAGLGH